MLGKTFKKPITSFKEYSEAAQWCNDNNCYLKEYKNYYKVVEVVQNEIAPKYEDLVVQYIRERYSENDEYAIMRKMIAGLDTDGFIEYNEFCENCKVRAKEYLENLNG